MANIILINSFIEDLVIISNIDKGLGTLRNNFKMDIYSKCMIINPGINLEKLYSLSADFSNFDLVIYTSKFRSILPELLNNNLNIPVIYFNPTDTRIIIPGSFVMMLNDYSSLFYMICKLLALKYPDIMRLLNQFNNKNVGNRFFTEFQPSDFRSG